LSKTQQRWYFFKLSDPRETHWDLPPGAFGAAPRKQTTQEKTSTRAVEEVLHVWYQRGALQGHNEAVGQVLQKVQQIGCDMSQEEHVAETEREATRRAALPNREDYRYKEKQTTASAFRDPNCSYSGGSEGLKRRPVRDTEMMVTGKPAGRGLIANGRKESELLAEIEKVW